ncbi:MAG TPA: heparan-alpha-glucosaminide N-acetyltransferase domain-containing protein [Patescibacteria group bacterium]|nr:heparan-alpha-glucosaminide N-acetyltransferase domain-containing protein [Patescibacteria group bacterium]
MTVETLAVTNIQQESLPAPTGEAKKTSSGKRLFVLDLARFIAMLMMMQGHTLDSLVTPQQLDINAFPWNIWHFLRGLTAPIFLLISGAVSVYAIKRNDDGVVTPETIRKRIRWAAILLGLGYLMMFPANRIFDLPFVQQESWRAFFQVNILHLNGVAMLMLIALATKTRSPEALGKLSFAVACGIAILTPFVHSVNWFNHLPEVLAAYLSYHHGSLFPIFPFGAYLFFGVALGAFLKRFQASAQLRVLKKRMVPIGISFLTVGFLLTGLLQVIPFPEHNFHGSSPAFVLIRIGIVAVFLSVVAVFYERTRRFEKFYEFYGKKALHIYIGHLVILYGTPWFPSISKLYPKQLVLADGLWIAVAVIGATLGSVYMLDRFQKTVNKGALILRYSSFALLAYALLR